eukprot:TRINITY_DN16729_c0_g1_i2.p1 TRINITY_DN16729_c0_g1~~TRINITY_DN16729_c0_g1_i2.p1  ORF type:complete len:334 (-),score=88.67 TRINITY_DN16729_c0_g1_i2:163-1164(-)
MCIRDRSAKGGSIPCVNPLNRLGFWVAQWQQLLLESSGHGFAGVVFDLESTGLSDSTLLRGTRHYLSHYLGSAQASQMQIGCTVGNTLPEPNSLYEGYDFWLLEAYNLYSAMLSNASCAQFLVDSLPFDQQGTCGRSCKGLACQNVQPPCSTSVYEMHKNQPRDLVGSHTSDASTFRELLVPRVSNSLQCTSSWSTLLNKQYEYAYDQVRGQGGSVEAAKASARQRVRGLFNKTTVLFSTETRIRPGDDPTCLYPDDGDCGVPKAFGTWDVEQVWQFVDVHFRTLSSQIQLDDGSTDQVEFSWFPQNYAGFFQFSFLPKSWLSSEQFECDDQT